MINIEEYAENIEDIEGWCDPSTAKIMHFLGSIQETPGDILEIGIHHGKSFIPIAATIKKNEYAIAIDIFEDQHLNMDDSGNGNRKMFEENLLKYFTFLDNVKIVKADSTKLSKDNFENKIRLMSIDGGHTKEITHSDLELANDICDESDAIIFLDDFLNPEWLGVLSGYLSYINDYPNSFIPVAYIPNKIVLCRPECAVFYKNKMLEHFHDRLCKTSVPFMNSEIDIYK